MAVDGGPAGGTAGSLRAAMQQPTATPDGSKKTPRAAIRSCGELRSSRVTSRGPGGGGGGGGAPAAPTFPSTAGHRRT